MKLIYELLAELEEARSRGLRAFQIVDEDGRTFDLIDVGLQPGHRPGRPGDSTSRTLTVKAN